MKTSFLSLRRVFFIRCRAANLSHQCDRLYPLESGFLSGLGHRSCVRRRARRSIEAIRGAGAGADEAVDEVFERCYSDLEPVGRRSGGPRSDGLAREELAAFQRAKREGHASEANKAADKKIANTEGSTMWTRLWPWTQK